MLALADRKSPSPTYELTPEDHENVEHYVGELRLHPKHHAKPQEIIEARKQALRQIKNVPKPSDEDVAKNRAQIANSSRPGGDLRGNTTDRARSRKNLFKLYGGEDKGYIPCPSCGLKLHHTTSKEENPNMYEQMERDKILTGHEGGRYTLSNLLPSCVACNRDRGDKPSPIGKPGWA